MIVDLSQEVDVILDKTKESVTASTNIVGSVIDLKDYDDIMIFTSTANLTAGKISFKIEGSNDDSFTTYEELPANAIKSVGDIDLYYTSSSDSKLKTSFGIIKSVPDYRYIRVTYVPDASAAAGVAGLTSVIVLKRGYAVKK